MTKFIMLIGLPCAYDVDEIARKENAEVISFDAVAEGCFKLEKIQNAVEEFFNEKKREIKEFLDSGRNVLFNTTNISGKIRSKFLFELKRSGVQAVAVFAATPAELCKKKFMKDKDDEKVFDRLYHNFEIPYYYEGWDKIEVLYHEDISVYKTNHIKQLFSGKSELYSFDQECKDHTLSLGGHLFETFKYVADRTSDRILKEAAILHDIGKLKIKKIDGHGEAYYPQHQYISAYDSMFEVGGLFDVQMKLLRAVYIQWHMHPYFIEKEIFEKRYKKLFGKEIFENLMLLHEGDRKSH
jgi:predicted kinase